MIPLGFELVIQFLYMSFDGVNSLENKVLEIFGLGDRAKEKFYKSLTPYVQILSSTEYKQLKEEANAKGGRHGDWAFYYVNIATNIFGGEHPFIVSRELQNLSIIVNRDSYPNEGFVKIAIRHEMAELWALSKMGFSLIDSVQNGRITLEDAIHLSHQHARLEEFRFAKQEGLLDDLIKWTRTISGNPQEDEMIYKKVLREK